MSHVQLIVITKAYGGDGPPAVARSSIAVATGEFFSLLGPSGCRQDDDVAHDRRLRRRRAAAPSASPART